jgi:hypothetical protein
MERSTSRRPSRSAILAGVAGRTRLRRALEEYVLDVARAQHFAWHPAPRPTDALRVEAHLDAARATERELIGALEALGAGTGDECDDARRHGLTFGIGWPAQLHGQAPGSTAMGKNAPLARRIEAAHVAERCLRLLARAESLTLQPYPSDTNDEVALGQFGAAGRAERVLWATLRALAA